MMERSARQAGESRPRPDEPSVPNDGNAGFPIVGLGASAGGLDAFKRFFDVVPSSCGMAFVLIQHLDPKHPSLMSDLLGEHTSMPVVQATDGMRVERDHVYLIPPGTSLAIERGLLRLSKPLERHGARMPVDFFLRSLATECGARAICAVLSGTGTDGSQGVKAVKEAGGLVIVQDPCEAAFDGMPRSAIASGDVSTEFVLQVDQMPQAMMRHANQSNFAAGRQIVEAVDAGEDSVPDIIDLLAAKTPRDFSLYKEGTLRRRIERRMRLAGLATSVTYLELLKGDAGERDLLAKDLLINVTHFFRDPAAFAELETTLIPDLVQRQTLDRPLRIWVPGCSTGEEAYSIAMLFLEQIALAKRNIKLQVFASDIDVDCLTIARTGAYPETIAADVSATRLARFFIKQDQGYQVVRELRETVVFTGHSLLSDAPYSRLDLISCRNVLIYLNPQAQHAVLSLFHFALTEGGVLFLGSSESVGDASEWFQPISKQHRLYRHVGRSRPGEVAFPPVTIDAVRAAPKGRAGQTAKAKAGFGELAQQALLEAYGPASVLINAKLEGLYFSGATDQYLKIVAGEDTRDVLAMARGGLRSNLRSALQRAKDGQVPITLTGASMERHGGSVGVSITVRPVRGENDREGLFLVSFRDEAEPRSSPVTPSITVADEPRIAQLERELEATRVDLQNAVHDLAIAIEEQKAVNEEAMSVNEEFQSTNEELEASQEELQSLNEELTALNGQLHETVEQQRATANDLQNILVSTDVATLFLDADLKIRFFTPAARSLFNVITTDIGRPLSDLTRQFEDGDLQADAQAVLAGGAPVRREVKARDGRWFMRGMLPYQQDANDARFKAKSSVGGVVITFSGISEMKIAKQEIEAARDYLDSIIATIRQPLVVLDEELCVISASRSFHNVFSVVPDKIVGRLLLTAGDHLDIPALRTFLGSLQVRGTSISDQVIDIDLPGVGRRSFLMSARALREGPTAKRKYLVAIVDVTEVQREGKALEAAKSEAERANAGKSRFLAAASHDLRQPLQTISLLQGMLERNVHDPATLKLVHRLDTTVGTMSDMLDKLLDINQLEAGIVRPAISDFPIKSLLDLLRAEFTYHAATHSLDWLVVDCRLAVRSDPRLLEQILRNLLANAFKYTTHGRLLLGCRRRGTVLRIEVWDTGPGIPEEQLQAIFEEFHQLDNPARERAKGLGLGLAIVQRLADLLGHPVDVRSKLGAGSVFAIEVPLGQTGLIAQAAASTSASVAQAIEPLTGTILIVEDDPAVLDMLQLLFTGEGHRTLIAKDGHEALALVAEAASAPNVMIADYNLPKGLSGLEVVQRINAQARSTVPAIILTGDISTRSLQEIAGSGCVHLNKPVRAKQLSGIVQRLLSQRVQVPSLPVAGHPNEPGAVVPTGDPQLSIGLALGGSSTIFVVDDDTTVRETLRDLLSADGFAVEMFAGGQAFLDTYSPGREGCLLVDAMMPGMSGIDLIKRLKSAGHQLPAIMITGNGAVAMAVQAMQAGAVDFIEKPVSRGDLLASIARARDLNQNKPLSQESREVAVARIASLTKRQRQILDLVLAGHPSKIIAADLGLSQRTVDNHRAAIMKKTGSASLPALIRTALAGV